MANTNRRYLCFDFVKDNIKDPIINFSRGSTKTIIDKNTGLVRTLGVNVPAAFDDACGRQELWKAGSKNLLAYSDDPKNSSVWNVTSAVALSSYGYLNGVGPITRFIFSTGGYHYQRPGALTNGSLYCLSFWAKKDTTAAVSVQNWGGNSWSAPIALTDTWTRYSVVMTGDGNAGNSSCGFGGATTAGQPFLVAGFQLEAGNTATTYEPNPVVFQPGLLIEGQATNYIPYSDFSTGVGVTAGVTKTSDFATAPDGTVTAARVQYNGSGAAGSYRYYATADTATAGQKRVLSVWLKSNNGTPTIRLNDNNNSWASITLSSTWKRYYLPGSGQAGSAWQPLIFSPVGDNSAFDILVWGAQVEDGQFPTSLIPTSGAAVTRAADAASIDVSKIWNASEGTIVCEADFGPVSSAYQTILDMSGNSFQIYRTPAGNFTISSVATAGAVTRVRAATTALKLSVNGGQVVAGSKPVPAPATLFIGTNSGVGEPLNGTLQNLIYVPYAVDDLSLKSLSMLK